MPEYHFPGLKNGDQWCLCALRWVEAYKNNSAPNLVLKSTHEAMLQIVPLEILETFAVDAEDEQ